MQLMSNTQGTAIANIYRYASVKPAITPATERMTRILSRYDKRMNKRKIITFCAILAALTAALL